MRPLLPIALMACACGGGGGWKVVTEAHLQPRPDAASATFALPEAKREYFLTFRATVPDGVSAAYRLECPGASSSGPLAASGGGYEESESYAVTGAEQRSMATSARNAMDSPPSPGRPKVMRAGDASNVVEGRLRLATETPGSCTFTVTPPVEVDLRLETR